MHLGVIRVRRVLRGSACAEAQNANAGDQPSDDTQNLFDKLQWSFNGDGRNCMADGQSDFQSGGQPSADCDCESVTNIPIQKTLKPQ